MIACLFFSFINIFPYQVFESLTLSIILCVVASVISPGTIYILTKLVHKVKQFITI